MEKKEKISVPGKLIKYLFWIWGGAINIGVDFGLLSHGRWNNGKVILIIILAVAFFFAINGTFGIINFFREELAEAENQLI